MALALAGCVSPPASQGGATSPSGPPASEYLSATSSTEPSLSFSASPDFGPCVADSGVGSLVGDVGALFQDTQDSLATGDIEVFADAAPEQAKQYDALGRKIKALDTCGDEKYGQLLADLGDVLIAVGSRLGLVTEQSLSDSDGSGVAQVQEIAQLISGAGNQMEVIGDYISEETE